MKALPVGERQFQLFCVGCGQPKDIVDYDEFLALSRGTYGPYYCFDCDSRHADEIPVNLAGEPPYLLKIGNDWFLIDPWRSAREMTRRFYNSVKTFQQYIDDRRKEKK
jgi:hypothetical protein